MDSKNDDIRRELEHIRFLRDGILRAEDVVEFARNERTALHSEFEWDDSEAAQQFRLEQARRVIRLVVTVVPKVGSDRPVQMYVSLTSDRAKPGGGYRPFVDVMSDEDRRDELLRQALNEFKRVRSKYEALRELRPIFKAIDKVEVQATAAEVA